MDEMVKNVAAPHRIVRAPYVSFSNMTVPKTKHKVRQPNKFPCLLCCNQYSGPKTQLETVMNATTVQYESNKQAQREKPKKKSKKKASPAGKTEKCLPSTGSFYHPQRYQCLRHNPVCVYPSCTERIHTLRQEEWRDAYMASSTLGNAS